MLLEGTPSKKRTRSHPAPGLPWLLLLSAYTDPGHGPVNVATERRVIMAATLPPTGGHGKGRNHAGDAASAVAPLISMSFSFDEISWVLPYQTNRATPSREPASPLT